MIKGLAITTPILGSIRLGEVVENEGGKRLPTRLNHFKITGQYKNKDGDWVEHPLHAAVAQQMNVAPDAITEIPIRLMFNDPELNMRARYEAYDRNGRIICAGDGQNARRANDGKIESVNCPGADYCPYGVKAKCDLFGRLNVMIDGQDDQFSSFIIRTESVNSVRTIYAKMRRMRAMFGGRLAGIPFKLKLIQKASKSSFWSKFFYFDIQLHKVTPIEAVQLAIEHEEAMEEAGLDMKAFEAIAREDLKNGSFEDNAEDEDELEPFLLRRESDEEGTGSEQQESPKSDSPETMQAIGFANEMPGLAELRELITASSQVSAHSEVPHGEDIFVTKPE